VSTILSTVIGHLLLAGAGAGVVVVLALGLRVLVRRDAVLRYRVMVGATIACAAILPVQIGAVELFVGRAGPVVQRGEAAGVAPDAGGAVIPRGETVAAVGRGGGPVARIPMPERARQDLAGPLLGVYVAGVLAMALWHAAGLWYVRRVLAGARAVTDARVLRVWGTLVPAGGRAPELLECDRLPTPACRAVGRACVILPAMVKSLDDDSLTVLLRHELVHIERRDGVVALAAVLVRGLLWFQPLVWVLARAVAWDREQSCDALVIRATGRARVYAKCLLRFCEQGGRGVRPVALIGFESARSVKRRIVMLSYACTPAGRARRLGLSAASLIAVAGASGAHGLFVAAADPGSLAPAVAVAPPGGTATAATATVEVRANADGRSDAQVYDRVMDLVSLDGKDGYVRRQRPKDGAFAFFVSDHPPAIAPGTWVSDEEQVLVARDARLEGDRVRAPAFRVRLPGGSNLRAVFGGKTVETKRGPDGRDRTELTGGRVRIVDEAGIVRAEIRAERDDATMVWRSTPNLGDGSFELAPVDGSAGLIASVDVATGVPKDEQRPPHGAVRWKFVSFDGGLDLRVYWIYDASKVRSPDGC
jgi:beta-lactamase regulating signal transducer with metallopeptidase domain